MWTGEESRLGGGFEGGRWRGGSSRAVAADGRVGFPLRAGVGGGVGSDIIGVMRTFWSASSASLLASVSASNSAWLLGGLGSMSAKVSKSPRGGGSGNGPAHPGGGSRGDPRRSGGVQTEYTRYE